MSLPRSRKLPPRRSMVCLKPISAAALSGDIPIHISRLGQRPRTWSLRFFQALRSPPSSARSIPGWPSGLTRERWSGGALQEAIFRRAALSCFRKPTVWSTHRYLVLRHSVGRRLQSLFVAALLFQRRKRRQAEISLKESEERMTFTAASVNVGLWQFDRTTDELWATEHCRAMFGLASDAPLTRDTILSAQSILTIATWPSSAHSGEVEIAGQPAVTDVRSACRTARCAGSAFELVALPMITEHRINSAEFSSTSPTRRPPKPRPSCSVRKSRI